MPLSGQDPKEIKKFNKIKNILVEFEFALYDGLYKTLQFPFFLFLLKLIGKRTVLVLHQVIFDLSQLSGHLGWKRESLISKIFSWGIKNFYKLMAFSVNKVIVTEEEFKKRLTSLGISKEKVITIPHGVDNNYKPINQLKAKKMLGFSTKEKIVLVFGFLTWYKGSDLILKQFKRFVRANPKTKIRLVLAGGESPTQKDKPHYQKYLKKLYKLANSCPKAQITGFVPEEKIPYYFSAADWVILPYRTFMSSSGPLSLAVTFNKPFLISHSYSKILNSFDFKKAMNYFNLKKDNLIWKGFDKLPSKRMAEKIQTMVGYMKQLRSFNNLGFKYLETIKNPSIKNVLPTFSLINKYFREVLN